MKGYDDYDAKKLYVIILSFFTIIIGVVCFSLGNYFDTNSLATEKLKTQISALEENTSSLTDTKMIWKVR